MSAPRTGSVTYLLAQRFRRMAYRSFGTQGAPVLVCVHGLTRNARDFDVLADALSDRHHVIAPDLPGRGESEWLEDPALYGPATYLTALSHLLAAINAPVDWLGTSLGGICGMELAATPGHKIRRMVLNDVGAFIPRTALGRIRDYLTARLPRFADVQALKLYLRRVHAPFGPLTEQQWLTLAENSARPLEDGSVALHYDPKIAVPYGADPIVDLDMWRWWDAIDIPLLTLRGESSDVLPAEVLERMASKTATLTIPDTGHAPALLDAPTIASVRAFLEQ